MNKKTIVVLTCLCIAITVMDISGLPGVLLHITVADVDPFILPLMSNFMVIGILAISIIKLFKIEYDFGFTMDGLGEGLKRFALPGIMAGLLTFVAFFVGLYPFDYKPTIYKILFEGILYYVGLELLKSFMSGDCS